MIGQRARQRPRRLAIVPATAAAAEQDGAAREMTSRLALREAHDSLIDVVTAALRMGETPSSRAALAVEVRTATPRLQDVPEDPERHLRRLQEIGELWVADVVAVGQPVAPEVQGALQGAGDDHPPVQR